MEGLWAEPAREQTHACAGATCGVCAADEARQSPALPYAGTSGWSGSGTSRERAVSADSSGRTGANQGLILEMLEQWGPIGLTWKEVAQQTGWHHGTASGTLSALHKENRIARLSSSRDGCKIYVLPHWTEGRDIETQGRKHDCPNCGHRF